MTLWALLVACLPIASLDRDEDGALAEVDCNDDDALVFPDAPESCDGLDQDCDGIVDDDATDATTWFEDKDGDGFGAQSTRSCDAPEAGLVEAGGDCDDDDALRNPSRTELCNDRDDDCDGTVDDAPVDGTLWYPDLDLDGYGDAAAGVASCAPVQGYVTKGGDCADADKLRRPLAAELCNEVDDDCDGRVDEDAADPPTTYADSDQDGFGDPDVFAMQCATPGGYVVDGSDCDDLDDTVYPDADELCDGVDHDCDGLLYVGAVNAATWYWDEDGDGVGDPGTSVEVCDPGFPWVSSTVGDDCDDTDPLVSPLAEEVCDPLDVDEDCDGLRDEADATGQTRFAGDGDGDDHGLAIVEVWACDLPSNASVHGDDCNDNDALVFPGAPERCSTVGVDDDCDKQNDEVGAVDGELTYVDADLDGFGDPDRPRRACSPALGLATVTGDCDDTSQWRFPATAEANCFDGVDNDCDGNTDLTNAGPADCQLASSKGATFRAGGSGTLATDVVSGAFTLDGFLRIALAAPTLASSGRNGMVFLAPLPSEADTTAHILPEVDVISFAGFDTTTSFKGLAAGRLNEDGFDDLAVGDNSRNQVYVLFGQISGSALDPTMSGAIYDFGGGGSGGALEVVGDLDGDGFEELLVGADLAGRARVLYGPLTLGSATTPGHRLGTPTAAGDGIVDLVGGLNFAMYVNGRGDLDADGLDDLVLGSVGTPGDVRVYFGSPTRLIDGQAADVTIVGDKQDAGNSVALLGDVNADGYDDFATVQDYNGTGDFEGLIVPGRGSGWSALTGKSLESAEVGSAVIREAAGGVTRSILIACAPGDVDGDGRADVVWSGDAGSRLTYGSPTAGPIHPFESMPFLQTQLGTCASLGDVNDDGRDEFVVNALADNGSTLFWGRSVP